MSDCIFCKIIDGSIPSHKIYEDESVLAFLDTGPLNPGHSLVIPKKHFENFSQCSEEYLSKSILAVHKVANASGKAVNCNGYNVLCNNGVVAGQLVEHVHFHIIPRFESDGVFDKWPAGKYETGQAAAVAEKIKEFI